MPENKKSKRRITTRDVAMIGVLTALVFAANQFSIPVPTMIDSTRIHLGNVMCLLSGLMLGPVGGGLAAGFGGMFYDFTNPLFVNEAWITFILKFAMAWLCGKIAWSGGADGAHFRRNLVAAIAGALFYVVLYLCKNFLMNYVFLRMALGAVMLTLVQKGVASLANGLIAVVIALPLHTALRAALGRVRVFQKPANGGNEQA